MNVNYLTLAAVLTFTPLIVCTKEICLNLRALFSPKVVFPDPLL